MVTRDWLVHVGSSPESWHVGTFNLQGDGFASCSSAQEWLWLYNQESTRGDE
jgi:hypothetical protein